MLSVLIITKNEEHDIARCLEALTWCDDIHVFDSYSDDNTVAIAAAAGARIRQRKFDNYAAQRNAALHGIAFKYPWVLSIDGDERVPGLLVAELREFVSNADKEVAAARIRRRDFFCDRWLKHAQLSPYFVRLVRPEMVRYEREVNEILMVDGKIGILSEPFDHYPFSKGIAQWVEKHNLYSTMEAERALHERAFGNYKWTRAIFSRDFNERRKHQKGLFYRLPGRPIIKFLYMILIRRAFLDGWPGVHYALLQASYEHFIILKEKELLVERSRIR